MDMADDWTRVRYGRRRQRAEGTGTWRTNRGMASAKSGPFWGRIPNPRPNQPVPRSGSRSRYFGPRSRSYADVTRQYPRRDYQRTYSPYQRAPAFVRNQYQPADPNFRKLIRSLHLVIKVVHHLRQVARKPGEHGPQMITRMVDTLSSIIKPALPTQQTHDLIMGNAKNWGHTTLLLLEDHYTTCLEEILGELKTRLPEDWKPAFEVATRWARKNLPRITREEIDHAEAMITACKDPDVVQPIHQQRAVCSTYRPALQNIAPQPTRNQRVTQAQVSTTRTVETMTDSDLEIPMVSPRRTMRELQDVGNVDAHQNTEPHPTRTGQISPVRALPTRTTETMTDGDVGVSESCLGPTGQEQPLYNMSTPLPRREQRFARRTRQPEPSVVPEHVFDDAIEEAAPTQVAPQRANPRELAGLVDDHHNRQDNTPIMNPTRPVTSPDRGRIRTTALVHQSGLSTPPDVSGTDWASPTDQELLTSVLSPSPNRIRVRTHIRTNRKMIDWTLSAEKKWLILGDSNLRRIPPYNNPNLQIDSYPGANFRHAMAIMLKATQISQVEKLVLAFGLNHRDQKGRETSIKQLQTAVRIAKRKFPYSEIWIPLINVSSRLPFRQQVTIQTLNDYITRNMGFIPALNKTQFKTESDDVHWTRTTAQAMYDHWVTFLNLSAP